VPYLITGDYYFLEELYFWASFALIGPNPEYRHRDWGYTLGDGQIRSEAWGLRSVAFAAFMAPDGTPESAYYTQKLMNNIAMREGRYDIRNGAFYDPSPSSRWSWGRSARGLNKPNPLYFLSRVEAGVTDPSIIDTTKACSAASPWMENYNHIVWGFMEELGYSQIATLRRTTARNLLHQILDPAYDPYLSASYRMPIAPLVSGGCGTPDTNNYFTSWTDVRNAFTQTARDQAQTYFTQGSSDVEHGYPHIAKAAASYLGPVSDGSLIGGNAWNWMASHVPNQTLENDNPKWSLVPRP
jgi:hypothetical protein